ncbi:hypothetical protein OUZ56_011801 [Daphnia magna]|uniref:Uncharacterized protein n=1 Tax=Daphnia magna TaxID=35525 RepID=A0ABQ9Z177_9CRUS|nr:hypothetical protein OUZ56_011801 [Daphnia magna]
MPSSALGHIPFPDWLESSREESFSRTLSLRRHLDFRLWQVRCSTTNNFLYWAHHPFAVVEGQVQDYEHLCPPIPAAATDWTSSTTFVLGSSPSSLQLWQVRSSDDCTVFENVDVDPHFGIVDDDVESFTSEEDVTVDHFHEEQPNVVLNSCDVEESDLSFRDKLASWAVLPGVKHVHVNKLLALLRTHSCHSDLPSDVRSLIGTPRVVVLHEVHPGHYYHFGVVKAIFSVVRANSRLQVEEKQDEDVEFYIREWLRHSQERCDRKGISPATYEDPMDQ